MRHKLLLLLPLLAVGCPKSDGPHPTPPVTSGPVVANFGEHSITTAELQRQFNEQSPFVRSHFQSMDKKKEFLQNIIQNQLLADEATKAGFDKDDEALDEFRKAIIQEWIRAKFNDRDGMKNISDADLHAYYDAHHDEYQRPERLRVQMVFFKAEPGGEAKVKSAAEQALKNLSQKKEASAFAELARLRSDDAPSKMRGGDLDFHTHDELDKSYGETVANAADSLKAPNDLSGVVHGNKGFYLLRLEARQPAFTRSFEQVEQTLRSRIWNERRSQLFDSFVKNMLDNAHIKVNEAELAKIDPNQPGALSDNAPPAPPRPAGQPVSAHP